MHQPPPANTNRPPLPVIHGGGLTSGRLRRKYFGKDDAAARDKAHHLSKNTSGGLRRSRSGGSAPSDAGQGGRR